MRELNVAVLGQHKRFSRFRQKFDELWIVSGRYAAQSGVGRSDERCHGGVQQGSERASVKRRAAIWRRTIDHRSGALGTPGFQILELLAWGCHGTASEDVGKDGWALNILDHKRNKREKFVFSEVVTEGRSPVDVVDSWVSVLGSWNGIIFWSYMDSTKMSRRQELICYDYLPDCRPSARFSWREETVSEPGEGSRGSPCTERWWTTARRSWHCLLHRWRFDMQFRRQSAHFHKESMRSRHSWRDPKGREETVS